MRQESKPFDGFMPHVMPFEGLRCERFETPTDNFGLVDAKALISHLVSLAGPDFDWDSEKDPDCHHLYWYRNLYPDTPDQSVNPAEFRELPLNKIIVPIPFHVLLHQFTEIPPVPDREVMYEKIRAHRIVRALFRNAQCAYHLERNRRYISDERVKRGRDFHLNQTFELLEKAIEIPTEFQPLDFYDFIPETFEDVRASAKRLGAIAIRASNRVRYIRQYAA